MPSVGIGSFPGELSSSNNARNVEKYGGRCAGGERIEPLRKGIRDGITFGRLMNNDGVW